MILIFVTFPNQQEADTIVEHLLNKKLIGCATIFPVSSRYWWEGKIVKDSEVEVILKTSENKFEKVQQEIKKRHSYSTPQIIAIEAKKVDEKYDTWLKGEVND